LHRTLAYRLDVASTVMLTVDASNAAHKQSTAFCNEAQRSAVRDPNVDAEAKSSVNCAGMSPAGNTGAGMVASMGCVCPICCSFCWASWCCSRESVVAGAGSGEKGAGCLIEVTGFSPSPRKQQNIMRTGMLYPPNSATKTQGNFWHSMHPPRCKRVSYVQRCNDMLFECHCSVLRTTQDVWHIVPPQRNTKGFSSAA